MVTSIELIQAITLSSLMIFADQIEFAFEEGSEITSGLRIAYSFLPITTLGPQPIDGAEVATFQTTVPRKLASAIAKSAASTFKVAGLDAYRIEIESEGERQTLVIASPRTDTLVLATSTERLERVLTTSSWRKDVAAESVMRESAAQMDLQKPCWGVRVFAPEEAVGLPWRSANVAPLAKQVAIECATNGALEVHYSSDSDEELRAIADSVASSNNGRLLPCDARCAHFKFEPKDPKQLSRDALFVLTTLGFGIAL